MKYIIMLLFISCYYMPFTVDNNKELDRFLSSISIGKLPIDSKVIEIDNTKHIENKLVTKYFLNGDTAKLYYHYYYYNNDNQKNIVEKDLYDYRSFCRFELGNIQLLVYYRIGNDIRQTEIASFSKDHMIDHIVIGYSKGGGDAEIIDFTEGTIESDYLVKTKVCIWNPEYTDQKRKENPDFPRSLITLSEYKIDQVTGKINLIKSEKKYSKCSPEEFSYKDSNCELF